MRKSVSVRSAMEMPDDRSSRSMTASCSLSSCRRRVLPGRSSGPPTAARSRSPRRLRKDVEQHHATAHALFQTQILLEFQVGPEVHELNARVGGADAVDASEALDDAYRVPVDVVVDEPIAVLKVLTFRDAVSGDEENRFSPSSARFLRPFLQCAVAKGGQDGRKVLSQIRQRDLVSARPG